MQLSHPVGEGKTNADTENNGEKQSHLLIMIHQMEGVLLIRIYRQNISNSYKAKSKSFVIVNDFCWIEASTREKNGHVFISLLFHSTLISLPASQVGLMNRSKTTS
jgi:hypothetical protein